MMASDILKAVEMVGEDLPIVLIQEDGMVAELLSLMIGSKDNADKYVSIVVSTLPVEEVTELLQGRGKTVSNLSDSGRDG